MILSVNRRAAPFVTQMQIRLKSLAKPPLEDVVIQDPLFAVGRDEAPFSEYDSQLTANLSRRHARIFQEAGSLYVADLGSRNGTRLNEKPVAEQPLKLHEGDVLSFAGKLDYAVQIFAEVPDAADTSHDRKVAASTQAAPALILVPKARKTRLQPLVVSEFPFLIGKKSPVFVRELEHEQEAAHYLSRRHAHIFVQRGQLWVEDLGSANGTYFNGERLADEPKPVNQGDELAFGAADLTFKVKLEPQAKAEKQRNVQPEALATSTESSAASGVAEPEDALSAAVPEEMREHTIFVSSANSFLDIFCADESEQAQAAVSEEEAAADEPEAAEDDAVAVKPSVKPQRGLVSRVRNARTFVGELRQALRDKDARNRRRGGWILASLLCVLAVGWAVYYQGSEKRDIQQSLNAGDFEQSALLAKAYLQQHPKEQEVLEWSTEAAVKTLMPTWIGLMAAKNYTAAVAEVERVNRSLVVSADATQFMVLLRWLTQLHQYVEERGGVNAPLRLFSDEHSVARFWQWWHNDEAGYRRQLQHLLTLAPEFGDLHRKSFSYLRALESEHDVYLPAVDRLKQVIERKLETDKAEELAAVFATFADQYPRVEGLQMLREDLANYLRLQSLLSPTGQPVSRADIAKLSFASEPFARRFRALQPQQDIAARQLQLDTAWREGQLAESLKQLEALAQETGSNRLAQQLVRRRGLMQEFQWLQSAAAKAGGAQTQAYQQRLQTLYRKLQPDEDAYLQATLQPEFQQMGRGSLEQASSAWRTAEDRWREYQRDGGIRGALRLEERISPAFRRKARLLSDAWLAVAQARAAYGQQQRQLSPEQQALYQKIRSESQLQRRSLQQLSMVLAPALLESKLALLADPSTGKTEGGDMQ